MVAGWLHVIQALLGVRGVQGFDGFQFDDDGALGQEIGGALADGYAVVCDSDPVLLGYGQAGPRPLLGQGARASCAGAFLMAFSRKPAPSVFKTWNAAPTMRSGRRLVSASSAGICG